MPDEPIRPNVNITETPEPLEVVNTQANDVDITVNPNATGDCQVLLHLIADDCGFLVDNKLVTQIETKVTAAGIFDSIKVNVPFTIVCIKPSESDILIRFSASATNSEGGISHPSPFFNVNLSFDSGERLAEILASVEPPEEDNTRENNAGEDSPDITPTTPEENAAP
jgi:hypothetical protein